MDLQLNNKTVFVSASSRGIGFATATLFLREGARVVINGRDSAQLYKTHQQLIKKFGIRKEKIELDKIMNNTELMQFLEICSGLKEEQIMKLYNSDLLGRNIKPSKNRRCKDCFFNILLEKDPHKREISYMSMMGIKVTEMIYGR